MARYIDADKIHEFVDAKVAEGKDGWAMGVPYEWAYALTVIDMQPTADVAPKSEVEFWQEEAANAKKEAVNEFAERLKKYYGNLNSNTAAGLVEYHIEQIKEEMLCEK